MKMSIQQKLCLIDCSCYVCLVIKTKQNENRIFSLSMQVHSSLKQKPGKSEYYFHLLFSKKKNINLIINIIMDFQFVSLSVYYERTTHFHRSLSDSIECIASDEHTHTHARALIYQYFVFQMIE